MLDGFIKFADLPPSPLDKNDLSDYKNLGFNVCLLTEDSVSMTKNDKLSENYMSAIENITEAGLYVFIRNMYNDADYFECDGVKVSSNYGTPYTLEPRKITDDFKKFRNVAGFYMADEAYMYSLPEKTPIDWMNKDAYLYSSFDKIEKLVEWKNKYYKDSFWHMNHVPSQSWDHYLPRGNKIYTYEDFLNEYVDKILKKLTSGGRSLCIDNYGLIGDDYIESDYLLDLLMAAKVTRDYNKTATDENKATFGICIQSFNAKAMNDDRRHDITLSSEITFQLFVGMALGARLFEFFLYRTYADMLGILDANGNHRIYDIVKEANAYVLKFENILTNYSFESAFVSVGSEHSQNTAAFITARHLFEYDSETDISSTGDTLITTLYNNEKKGYMLVNYSAPTRNITDKVTVTFNGEIPEFLICSGGTSSVNSKTICIDLKPGDAAFIY